MTATSQGTSPPRCICLWSGPRNVSTALMYSFRQRSDVSVIDEPLYGHYLRESGVAHPGREEVLENMQLDGNKVMKELLAESQHGPNLFLKQMAHHLTGIDHDFLAATDNVFLIRDPEQMLPSLINQVPEPSLRDTGLKIQADLFDELVAIGQTPPVLDAKQLLLDPARVLELLCRQLGLSFEKAMLSWSAGPKPEDGIWAKHWYHNVHHSTGFMPYTEKKDPFPDQLAALLETCKPHYDKLASHAIKSE